MFHDGSDAGGNKIGESERSTGSVPSENWGDSRDGKCAKVMFSNVRLYFSSRNPSSLSMHGRSRAISLLISRWSDPSSCAAAGGKILRRKRREMKSKRNLWGCRTFEMSSRGRPISSVDCSNGPEHLCGIYFTPCKLQNRDKPLRACSSGQAREPCPLRHRLRRIFRF